MGEYVVENEKQAMNCIAWSAALYPDPLMIPESTVFSLGDGEGRSLTATVAGIAGLLDIDESHIFTREEQQG
jgi:hypothetical protein